MRRAPGAVPPILLAACASCAPAPASRAPVIAIPQAAGNPKASTPRAPGASVAASLLGADGQAYAGADLAVVPDPADIVRPCYSHALASDHRLAGYAYIDMKMLLPGTRPTLLESSPLPETLIACMLQGLASVRWSDQSTMSPMPVVIYVSLGPKPP